MTIEKPDEGAVATTVADATVRGLVVGSGDDGTVDCVLLTLTRLENNQPVEVDRRVTTLTEGPHEHPFTWTPKLPYNDTYTVFGQALGRRFGNQFAGSPSTRQFRTEIPPVRPSGLKIVTDQASRTVTLTWTKNPEPDVVGYIVDRAAPERDFEEVGSPVDPTFSDKLANDAPAGSYRYHVVAVRRKSQDPTAGGIESPAPAEGRVTVAAAPTQPPPGSTTTRPTATTARSNRSRTPNRVDLRRFTGPTSTLPDDGSREPEEGAFGDLEFGERQDGRTDMTITELGEPVTEDGDDRPTSLLFFAGGLLAFVVLLHLRWIKKEVDRVPLEELPPQK